MINSDMHAYGAARVGGGAERRQQQALVLAAAAAACVLECVSRLSADQQGHTARAPYGD